MDRTDLIYHWGKFQRTAMLTESDLCASVGEAFVQRHGAWRINFERFANWLGEFYPSADTRDLKRFAAVLEKTQGNIDDLEYEG